MLPLQGRAVDEAQRSMAIDSREQLPGYCHPFSAARPSLATCGLVQAQLSRLLQQSLAELREWTIVWIAWSRLKNNRPKNKNSLASQYGHNIARAIPRSAWLDDLARTYHLPRHAAARYRKGDTPLRGA